MIGFLIGFFSGTIFCVLIMALFIGGKKGD